MIVPSTGFQMRCDTTGVFLHDQFSESVAFAISQLTQALARLDAAGEHVAAALVADALSRLGSDVAAPGHHDDLD